MDKKIVDPINTEKEKFEEEIPPTEDLMREHGILNRVLLVYEEIIKRMENSEFPRTALMQAVSIIKEFIEDYHEKMEEEYIFPIFEKKKKKLTLVKTLRLQHIRGREVTSKIKEIIESSKVVDQHNQKMIVKLLKKFIKMYRPHESREDTELFPLVRTLITEKEFNEIGEFFESSEHELFGKEGFEGILKKVIDIEKELGINNLEQFTPEIKG